MNNKITIELTRTNTHVFILMSLSIVLLAGYLSRMFEGDTYGFKSSEAGVDAERKRMHLQRDLKIKIIFSNPFLELLFRAPF